MAALLATITAAAQDIKTAELLTTAYTADAARWVMLQPRVSGLLNTAATITARLRHLTAADAVLSGEADSCAAAKAVTTNTTWGCRPLGPIYLAAGEKAQIGLFSTNAGDSGVTYTILVLDAESGAADAASAATNSASMLTRLTETRAGNLDNLDRAITQIPAAPSAASIAEAAAAEILEDPANKLATGADGSVTASNAGEVDANAIAAAVLASIVDGTVDVQTALARLNAFARGKFTYANGELTYYAEDGETVSFAGTVTTSGRTPA